MDRWSIFVDVEGFSHIYETSPIQALSLLGCLSKYTLRIGKIIMTEEKIFIHQLGDGFLIVSDLPSNNLYRPLLISICLLRALLLNGGVGRAAISHGDFADIQDCYPSELTDSIEHNAIIRIGDGFMSIWSVMGNALIKPYKLLTKCPKGPCLFVDPELKAYLPNKGFVYRERNDKYVQVNWITSDSSSLQDLMVSIGLPSSPIDILSYTLGHYIKQHKLTETEWSYNALSLTQN